MRNRILEIRKLADLSQWKYINTSHIIADIGIRKGAEVADVDKTSTWINEYHWMKQKTESFPMKSVSQKKFQ